MLPPSVTKASGEPYSSTARYKTERNAARSWLRKTPLARIALDWFSSTETAYALSPPGMPWST